MDTTNISVITTGFNNLFNDLKGLALAVCVFMFAWAALMLIFAAHNERQQLQGRLMLWISLIGMVLILLSPAIVNIVFHAFGGKP